MGEAPHFFKAKEVRMSSSREETVGTSHVVEFAEFLEGIMQRKMDFCDETRQNVSDLFSFGPGKLHISSPDCWCSPTVEECTSWTLVIHNDEN